MIRNSEAPGIDLDCEALITLADAAKLVPTRRGGRPCNVSCVYRWTLQGLKGVRLEFIQAGGTRCTSREALARFFQRLTAAHGGAVQGAVKVPTPRKRRRAAEKADAELQRAGI